LGGHAAAARAAKAATTASAAAAAETAAATAEAITAAAEPVATAKAVTAACKGIETVFSEAVPLVPAPTAPSSVKTHRNQITSFRPAYTAQRRGRYAPGIRANGRRKHSALSSAGSA
jgi:hypothetical protein